MKEKITDPIVGWEKIIRHFVIGGHPGKEALSEGGEVISQVEYYQKVLENIMRSSGLSVDEVRRIIKKSPDTRENSDKPNYKHLYLQALDNIRCSEINRNEKTQ